MDSPPESPADSSPEGAGPRGSLPVLAGLCAVGVGIRLAFLLLAGDLQFQSDEANYVYLAMSWNHFGFYSDSFRYLWPPGYPLFLATCLDLFGSAGIFAAKLVQVLASGSVGLSTMLFARRLFGPRAAVWAGLLWAGYLPLVGFTHYLWNETLFLALFAPALLQLLVVIQAGDRARDRNLVAAGVLFAAALHVKEFPLYLSLLLGLVLVVAARPAWRQGFRRGSLFLLTLAVCLAPWTIRNWEVYGRFVPVGTSLGENVYGGLNAAYKNFDLTPFGRRFFEEESPEALARADFVYAPPGGAWERAEHIRNTPDRLAENTRRGVAYALDNPGWLARSRVKKLADLVAPFSFFVRHQGLDRYAESPLGARPVRRALVAVGFASPVLLLIAALCGWFGTRLDPRVRLLVGTVVAYVLATSLLVSMSRFRIPMVPLLIVLAAGALVRGFERRSAGTLAGLATALLALGFLWWVDLPETLAVFDFAWRAGS